MGEENGAGEEKQAGFFSWDVVELGEAAGGGDELRRRLPGGVSGFSRGRLGAWEGQGARAEILLRVCLNVESSAVVGRGGACVLI